MPGFQNPYHYVYLLARQRLVRLQERIAQLQGQRYPTDIPATFLEACRVAADIKLAMLGDEASRTLPRTMDGDDPLSHESLRAHDLVDGLELGLLRLVERASISETPLEWIMSISHFITELEPDTKVLFCSVTDKNYITYPEFGPEIGEWFTNLGCQEASTNLPGDLAAIEMCSRPPTGSLGYPLVSHEVAHILCNKRKLVDDLLSEPTPTDACRRIASQGVSFAKECVRLA